MPDDPRVHGVELGVGARPGDVAGVVDLVADGEPGDLRAGLHDGPGGVEAEDLLFAAGASGDLQVDRVDRDGLDLDQDVVGAGRGTGTSMSTSPVRWWRSQPCPS